MTNMGSHEVSVNPQDFIVREGSGYGKKRRTELKQVTGHSFRVPKVSGDRNFFIYDRRQNDPNLEKPEWVAVDSSTGHAISGHYDYQQGAVRQVVDELYDEGLKPFQGRINDSDPAPKAEIRAAYEKAGLLGAKNGWPVLSGAPKDAAVAGRIRESMAKAWGTEFKKDANTFEQYANSSMSRDPSSARKRAEALRTAAEEMPRINDAGWWLENRKAQRDTAQMLNAVLGQTEKGRNLLSTRYKGLFKGTE